MFFFLIRLNQNLQTFKKILKTHMFSETFDLNWNISWLLRYVNQLMNSFGIQQLMYAYRVRQLNKFHYTDYILPINFLWRIYILEIKDTSDCILWVVFEVCLIQITALYMYVLCMYLCIFCIRDVQIILCICMSKIFCFSSLTECVISFLRLSTHHVNVN